jgi:hypothetical protein
LEDEVKNPEKAKEKEAMPLVNLKSRPFPMHLSVLSTETKPTAGIPYGATLIESDTYLTNPEDAWYLFTAAGWVKETLPVIIATLSGAIPAGDNNIGNVDVVTLPGTVQTDIATLKADLALIKADISTIKTTGTPVSVELPAGTKNIGDVDVLTLPNVTIGTLPALVAGDANIGNVDIVTLPGTVESDIGTTKDDVALIKAAVPIDGSTKNVTVLDSNVTLTAGAADHESGVWDLQDGYGGILYLKNTNGATGPTVAAASQVWVSPDGTNYYKHGGAIGWTLGNGVVTSLAVAIPQGVKYVKVVSGSNTGQGTVLRAEGVEVTAQS